MADQKISQLTDGGASQATDEYVVARSGANYRIDGASVAAAATSVGTLTSLTVSGVTTLSAGTASAPALTTSGDTNNGIFFPAADVTAITTAGTERLRVDASGNLGLGVTPSYKLHVSGAAALFANGTSDVDLYLGNSGYGFKLDYANGNLLFRTNTTERVRITNGGYFKASNAGTYVDSTGSYHEFRNTANAQSLIVSNTNASFGSQLLDLYVTRDTTNGSYNVIRYYNTTAAAARFIVADSGNVTNTNGSYGTISDIKHKQDVVDAPSQWDDLKAIRFRKYRMKAEVEANADAPYLLGVVAQELQAVSPGLVEAHPDTEQVEVTDEDGNVTTEERPTGTETLSVKSSILLMKAAVALQEAITRIEALEARLEALEA